MLIGCTFRYYRDPEQAAPAPDEAADGPTSAAPQRVALDPEALLREAEEGVDNLDEVSFRMASTRRWF